MVSNTQKAVYYDSENEDEIDPIERSFEENPEDWTKVLGALMSDLHEEHKLQRQNHLRSQNDTVYGQTAKLAEFYLDEATLHELRIVFEYLLKGLANTNYPGNRKPGPDERPSVLWERFALHYLRYTNNDTHNTQFKAFGGKGDNGVDIEIQSGNEHVLVQVKRGDFFGKGKGPRIVRELCGSMKLYNTLCSVHGIIFTNESKAVVEKKAVEDHILTYKQNGINIRVICYEEILSTIFNPMNDANLLRRFIKEFLYDGILTTMIQTLHQ